jgi:hypothetical protein
MKTNETLRTLETVDLDHVTGGESTSDNLAWGGLGGFVANSLMNFAERRRMNAALPTGRAVVPASRAVRWGRRGKVGAIIGAGVIGGMAIGDALRDE